jgi:UPF0755 protein
MIMVLAMTVIMVDFFGYIDGRINLNDSEQVFVLEPGSSLSSASQELAQLGVITRPLYWKIYARINGKANQLKAGEYLLREPLTPGLLLDQLVGGKTLQYSITIPEGWTFSQMRAAIAANKRIEQKSVDWTDQELFTNLDLGDDHPEGWFLPETYFFTSGTTDLELLRRSHLAMKRILESEWISREENLPLKSPYEALILASIVEKETAVADERPTIAAVFINRLRKGMRLQTDPTVIYGMGDRYKGNIRKSDLKRDTPYNTYTRAGLPPTPIALPSAASIRAVLNPAESEALFFVASGGGRHHFTNTYEEHKQAVIKYLLGGNASRYKGDQ